MNKEEQLDVYIEREFSDIEDITFEQRKMIADTIGFAKFQLRVAWTEFRNLS